MTRTRWLVDGMNVIGSRPDGWWRDRPAAVRRLTDAVARWRATHGDEVTVVYDGRPIEGLSEGVQVSFASRRGPNAADDDIVSVVAADRDAASLRVVTSDAMLAERVKELGATVMPARAFRALLDG